MRLPSPMVAGLLCGCERADHSVGGKGMSTLRGGRVRGGRPGASDILARTRSQVNVSLLHVLRIVIRADSDPARQTLFANLMRSHWPVRVVYRLHERLGRGWAAALLVSCYGLAAFLAVAPPRRRGARIVALAVHENARHQVARIVRWIGAADCGWVRSGLGALLRPLGLVASVAQIGRGRPAAVLRIARRIDRRHGFLVACRGCAAIAWYARGRALLGRRRPGVVLVSSDSNPEEVGFAAAARALGVPQVYVSHAYPTPYAPPLDFTLSILEGDAAVEARRRGGAIRGDVLLAGIEGESAPLDASRLTRPNPVIGVFTPKAIAWPMFAALIDDCRRHCRAGRLIIRWHPSMLEAPRLAAVVDDVSGIVESPRTAALVDVARQCDWVVADENSNVHLPVLKLGIPTIAIRRLGLYPESRSDLYGFIAAGVVYAARERLRDVDPAALASFFSDEWTTRFREYDASYLRSTEAIGREVGRAVWRLVEQQPAVQST